MADVLQYIFIAVLLILPLVYELSGHFRYYTKIFFYYIGILIAAVFVILCSLWRPGDVDNFRYVIMVIRWFPKIFGIDMEVRGKEHLQGAEPCIFVANHQSSLDFLGMIEVWPPRCVPLVKREIRYMFTLGLACILTGTVFIDRLNRDNALSTMESVANLIVNKKLKIFIFPEGTRNHHGGMLPFKKGAFHLAIQAQVPIVPVVFSTYSDFYSHQEKRFDTGKLIITCLPSIPTVGLTAADASSLAESTREKMLQVFTQTSTEFLPDKNINGSD